MARGSLKTEAIVLRSIRYGEADRILHLYTPGHGRLGAIAKGARRARSRFGARLEPFFHVRARPARGPRRAAHGDRRRHGRRPRRRCATTPPRSTPRRARATRSRGCSRPTTRTRRCSRCSPTSSRCSTPTPATARPANGLAFRLKLLLAAGIVPQLGGVRRVRRDRAPARLLGRRRRRRLQLLRGGGVPARRGVLPVPGRRRSAAARAGARRRPSARCARSSARSPRPPSTTRTCTCGRCCQRVLSDAARPARRDTTSRRRAATAGASLSESTA